MNDQRKHVDFWWWFDGGTGGDGAVARNKVNAPEVDGAGCVKADRGRGRGRGQGKKAGGGRE